MLYLSNTKALVDQEILIQISNLKPQAKIRLILKTKDRFDHLWKSSAYFQANDKGFIDLSLQAPYAGSYDCPDSMGLFWSMTSKQTQNMFIPPEREMRYILELYIDHILAEQKEFYRYLFKDIETKHLILDDLNALMCFPKSFKSSNLVITLTGSNGGLSPERAKLLASYGVATCALAYFSEQNLPKNLEEIPLEYVVQAIDKIKSFYPGRFSKIILYGKSKGAELTLCIASYFPYSIDAVIASVPSNYVWVSPSHNFKSSWTFQGRPLPFIQPPKDKDLKKIENLSQVHLQAIKEHFLSLNKAEIPLKNITCPLLIFTAEDDKLWPSYFFGEKIDEQLKSRASYKHVSYPKAGHMLNFPYFPTTSPYHYHSIFKCYMDTGGKAYEHYNACLDSWTKIKKFIFTLS